MTEFSVKKTTPSKKVTVSADSSLKRALKEEIAMHKDAKHSIANTAFFKTVEKMVNK